VSYLNNFNIAMMKVESYWNMADCVPILGMYTGLIRQEAGKYQCMGGLVIAIMGKLAETYNPKSLTVKTIKAFGQEQAVHGVLNAIRGMLTYQLGKGTSGMGNILLVTFAESISTYEPPMFKYGCFLYGLDEQNRLYRG
jgi:hypothetical protein